MRRLILGAGISPLLDRCRVHAGGNEIDPAFLVTSDGEAVTNGGIPVTYGTDLDPDLIVTNENDIVTRGGAIVTQGA